MTTQNPKDGPRIRGSMLAPRFRFLDLGTDVKRKQGRNASYPEHRPPAPHGKDKASGKGCQQVANGIPALKNPRKNTAPAGRGIFHGKRCAHTPFPTHSNSVECAQNEKDRVVRSETA